MRRYTHGVIALLLALASISLSPLSRPETALADDAEISSCDFTTFSTVLAAVQTSGGGTITFACAGTLTFAEVQTITTAVQIDGGGNEVIFDGENETGFFVVESDASLELTGLVLQHGSAEDGGAIDNQGTLTVIDSTFSGNNAGTFGDGGAILSNGTLTVTRSHFDNNGARFGGALYASGATITDSSFENNSAAFGAAIRSLGTMTVTASRFITNQADIDGGAFYNAGELTIIASAFEGNTANEGGAINSATAEPLTVRMSTFEGNIATASGGAIYHHFGAPLNVTASTFEGNIATADGGAIYNRGALTVTASTFSENSAGSDGGTLFNSDEGTATLQSSILAGNPGPAEVCAGAISSGGYNLSSDSSCAFADGTSQQGPGVPIDLGPLQDNGGETRTMLPLSGSAAIDAIPTAVCLSVSTSPDQRGVPRPQGPACDIGAVEAPAPVSLCVNRYTGALSAPAANGNCPTGSVVLTVPGPSPITFCISPFTGAISWSPQGTCGSGSRMHIVPDDGPLYYCQSLFTGALRYSATGACGAYERPGVIPGGGQAPPQRS